MKEWNDDKELVSLIKGELYTAVVGDIMDKMGYTHQFLPPHIRPLRDDMFVAGRAMTVLEADVYDNQGTSGTNPVLKRSFGLMLEALDDLKEGEIYICSGSSPSYALWGELMSARAMQCKACRCGGEWLLSRYERNSGFKFSLFFLRSLCSGSGSARKGD